MRDALKPFSDKEVQTKPGRGGSPPLKYVSHGSVTKRLLELDPTFDQEVKETFVFKDDTGRLHCEGVILRLTFTDENGRPCVIEEAGGAQRVGVSQNGRTDGFAIELKNAISDAVKRAAMRRGIGLGMWEELIDAAYDEDVHPAYESTSTVRTNAHPESALATPFQHLLDVAHQAGIDRGALDRRCQQLYGANAEELDKSQLHDVTALVKAKLPKATPPGAQPPSPSDRVAEPRPNGTGASGGITDKQLGKIWATANEKGTGKEGVHAFIGEVFNKTSTKELNKTEAGAVIEWLLEQPDHHAQEELMPAGAVRDSDWVYRTP